MGQNNSNPVLPLANFAGTWQSTHYMSGKKSRILGKMRSYVPDDIFNGKECDVETIVSYDKMSMYSPGNSTKMKLRGCLDNGGGSINKTASAVAMNLKMSGSIGWLQKITYEAQWNSEKSLFYGTYTSSVPYDVGSFTLRSLV